MERFALGSESCMSLQNLFPVSTTTFTPPNFSGSFLVVLPVKAKDSRAMQNITRRRRLFLEPLEQRIVLTGPAVTIDGLVSWYRAEGNANDSVGSNNGELVFGATTVAGGRVGKAFEFSTTGNRVEIPGTSSLSLQAFTIDAWVLSHFPGSLGDV